jgi:hypothetical protein
MRVSHGRTNRFGAKLHEGNRELLCSTDRASGGVPQSHAGLTDAPSDFREDLEEFRSENYLGCARGVLWSLVFEGAVVAGIAIYWILRRTL